MALSLFNAQLIASNVTAVGPIVKSNLIELFLSYNLIYNALSYHKRTLSYERFFAGM